MQECFAARDAFILAAPCYAEARGHAREPLAFIHSLAKHWATDPAYASKLISYMDRYNLYQWDLAQ